MSSLSKLGTFCYAGIEQRDMQLIFFHLSLINSRGKWIKIASGVEVMILYPAIVAPKLPKIRVQLTFSKSQCLIDIQSTTISCF